MNKHAEIVRFWKQSAERTTAIFHCFRDWNDGACDNNGFVCSRNGTNRNARDKKIASKRCWEINARIHDTRDVLVSRKYAA